MASSCLDMYSSSSSTAQSSSMSPRISFSNDFVDSNHSPAAHHIIQPRQPPPAASPDFEFSVTNYSMMSADELFFKGRLLPFKDCQLQNNNNKPTTLREELLVEDDEEELSLRPPKGSNKWKEILGLRKAHTGSKKPAKPDWSIEKKAGFGHDQEGDSSKSTHHQEVNNGGTGGCRDVEFKM
ncbi:uncharacterized protein LOC127804117 [Diospyros lotus]|uniref:uncharacterized protein LOC127804117 n=1 Tax=Diospyros lotus TaxID=55363 RepID=UPI00225A527B|nr:uncharacterized protein LOC127804117 [Diospyros lotus]